MITDNISPVAYFHSPLKAKFGIPRQSGVVDSLEGDIVFEKPFDNEEAVRGLEEFDYLWIVWLFSENHYDGHSMTVRPPRLGGNERVGIFASRSPFRPNNIGLSCVRIKEVKAGRITVLGADLMDGTPILDVKPYIAYCDSHPDARSGFTDTHEWQPLLVTLADGLNVPRGLDLTTVTQLLSQDPRPHYHHDGERIYGMPFGRWDVRFRVRDNTIEITEIL